MKETVAKWIAHECSGYAIAGFEVKDIDYMDDEEKIHKMTTIQSKFAEWIGMRFEIHKCANWGREFVRGRKEDVVFEDFNLCSEVIPQLEGYEFFKYLGEHKARIRVKTN